MYGAGRNSYSYCEQPRIPRVKEQACTYNFILWSRNRLQVRHHAQVQSHIIRVPSFDQAFSTAVFRVLIFEVTAVLEWRCDSVMYYLRLHDESE